MQYSAVAIEVSAELWDLDTEHLEVEAHPADRLPLHGGDVHAVDGAGDVGGHLDEQQREGISLRDVLAAGSRSRRRDDREQEVQTPDVLNTLDGTQAVAQRLCSHIAACQDVIVI